jgi:hypothetical protein
MNTALPAQRWTRGKTRQALHLPPTTILSKENDVMKTIVTTLAVALAFAFAAPAFAADAPKTKADCEKANMHWDDATKSCTKKQ